MRKIILLLLFSVLLTSCSNRRVEINAAIGVELGVAIVSIDTDGTVKITLSSSPFTTLPTPLGNFGPFVEASVEFPTQKTLSIVTENRQWIYDLHDQEFEFILDSVDATVSGDGKGNVKIVIRGGGAQSGIPASINIPTSTNIPDSYCAAKFHPRLSIGETAQVIVFQVNIRTSPGLSASKVNYLARNRIVQVLDGPRCANDSWWWKIYSDDLGYGGWVMEADHENYYLSP